MKKSLSSCAVRALSEGESLNSFVVKSLKKTV